MLMRHDRGSSIQCSFGLQHLSICVLVSQRKRLHAGQHSRRLAWAKAVDSGASLMSRHRAGARCAAARMLPAASSLSSRHLPHRRLSPERSPRALLPGAPGTHHVSLAHAQLACWQPGKCMRCPAQPDGHDAGNVHAQVKSCFLL